MSRCLSASCGPVSRPALALGRIQQHHTPGLPSFSLLSLSPPNSALSHWTLTLPRLRTPSTQRANGREHPPAPSRAHRNAAPARPNPRIPAAQANNRFFRFGDLRLLLILRSQNVEALLAEPPGEQEDEDGTFLLVTSLRLLGFDREYWSETTPSL